MKPVPRDGERDTEVALLEAAQAGDVRARNELYDRFYPRWWRLARERMSRERPDDLLQATAVLNEALLRVLRGGAMSDARSPALLHSAVAKEMERVLIDRERSRSQRKRGGDRKREPLDVLLERFDRASLKVEDMVRELNELEEGEPSNRRPFHALRLQVFGLHTVKEIAELLEVSESMAEKDLHYAKALLRQRQGNDGRRGAARPTERRRRGP